MKYTQDIVNSAIANALIASEQAALEFKKDYPFDRGSCGGCCIVGISGRQRKLKEFIENTGHLGQNWGDGMGWSFRHMKVFAKDYMQQWEAYACAMETAAMNVLIKELELDLHLHTWVD